MNPYRTMSGEDLVGYIGGRWAGSNVLRATFQLYDELKFTGVEGKYIVWGVTYGALGKGFPEIVTLLTPTGTKFNCDAELLIRARMSDVA